MSKITGMAEGGSKNGFAKAKRYTPKGSEAGTVRLILDLCLVVESCLDAEPSELRILLRDIRTRGHELLGETLVSRETDVMQHLAEQDGEDIGEIST